MTGRALGLAVLTSTSLIGAADADDYYIDSDKGTINGATSGLFPIGFGTDFVYWEFGGFQGDVAVFLVHGDFDVSSSAFCGEGSRGVQFRVANDVKVLFGGFFLVDFAAQGDEPVTFCTPVHRPGPGGGHGGVSKVQFMAPGGFAQPLIGLGGPPGIGGVGGLICLPGLSGTSGTQGTGGGPGFIQLIWQYESEPGSDGIASPGSGGEGNILLFVPPQAFAVAGGDAGQGNGALGGGAGGAGGGAGQDGQNGGSGGSAGPGGAGEDGRDGVQAFAPSGGWNTGTTEQISGGGGGACGPQGLGGGGGGAGGGGMGGGGGGGGGGDCFPNPAVGGSGGAGGDGGSGGIGGLGGDGGIGGDGGDGGGAFSIVANGRVILSADILAGGSDGSTGHLGTDGDGGGPGEPADPGNSGNNPGGPAGGTGGDGGTGRAGGHGGHGGHGAPGGNGGGGGGGSIKIFGSVVDLTDASFDVDGGAGNPPDTVYTYGEVDFDGHSWYDGNGFPGRILIGDNVTGDPQVYESVPADIVAEYFDGPRDDNFYLEYGVDTPYIPGLIDGADLYGLTDLAASDVPGVVENAPPGAIVAMALMDVGPAGFDDDYDGFDMLLIVNVAGRPIPVPSFGYDVVTFENRDWEIPLVVQGTARNPEFGGDGVVALTQLDADAVWVTLVPESFPPLLEIEVDFSVPGMIDDIAFDNLRYLVGEVPCPGDTNGSGVVDVTDLLNVILDWGTDGSANGGDVDGSGVVGVTDLQAVILGWGDCP